MSNQSTNQLTASPVSLFRTKTFWSVTLMLLGQLLPRYAKTFNFPGAVDYILTWIEMITLIGGFIGTNWGRLHATKQAAISPPSPPAPPAGKDEIGTPAKIPPGAHGG